MTNLPVLSHSEVDSFGLCQRRHYYAFGERLVKRKMSNALTRGISGHGALAVYFSNGRSRSAMSKHNIDLLKTTDPIIATEVNILTNGFLDWYEDRISQWTIEAVEQEYRLEFPDFVYAFTVDLVTTENGILKFIDWKFTYDFYDDNSMALLPQIPRYVGAARALGMSVREGMYGFIRYRKLNNESDKYKIVPQSFTSKRVQNSFKDLINSGKEILEFKSLSLEEWKDNTSRVANNLVCKSCSFRELCVAELNGSDGKVIREVDFEVNTRYGYVEGELE